MIATYVDVNEFTVTTDRTAEFINGRRIKADCGVNGIKYCTVLSSAFGAVTTVITKESELTVNLTTVLYGIVEPKESGSLPDHCHDGSEGSGGSALGTSGDVTFAQSIIVDEIRSDKAGGLRLGGYDVTYTDIDFTDPAWTEEDPGTDIVVTATKVAWTALPENLDSYVYYDFTAAYFNGDFRHEFECELTAADDGAEMNPWSLSNDVEDAKWLYDNDKDCLNLIFYRNGASYYLYLYECNGGVIVDDNVEITVGTTYYLTVVRDESVGTFGALYCYIYTDSARTILHAKLDVTLTEKQDFRYLWACLSYNSGNGALTVTGFTQNLTLSTDPFGIEKGIYVHDDGTVDMEMQSGVNVAISDNDDIPNDTLTTVQFDTEEFDTQNEHNTGTYTTTVSTAGIRQVSIIIRYVETIADTTWIDIYLYKNGNVYTYIKSAPGRTTSIGHSLSVAMKLDANDTLCVKVKQGDGAARMLDSACCRFSVIKVG